MGQRQPTAGGDDPGLAAPQKGASWTWSCEAAGDKQENAEIVSSAQPLHNGHLARLDPHRGRGGMPQDNWSEPETIRTTGSGRVPYGHHQVAPYHGSDAGSVRSAGSRRSAQYDRNADHLVNLQQQRWQQDEDEKEKQLKLYRHMHQSHKYQPDDQRALRGGRGSEAGSEYGSAAGWDEELERRSDRSHGSLGYGGHGFRGLDAEAAAERRRSRMQTVEEERQSEIASQRSGSYVSGRSHREKEEVPKSASEAGSARGDGGVLGADIEAKLEQARHQREEFKKKLDVALEEKSAAEAALRKLEAGQHTNNEFEVQCIQRLHSVQAHCGEMERELNKALEAQKEAEATLEEERAEKAKLQHRVKEIEDGHITNANKIEEQKKEIETLEQKQKDLKSETQRLREGLHKISIERDETLELLEKAVKQKDQLKKGRNQDVEEARKELDEMKKARRDDQDHVQHLLGHVDQLLARNERDGGRNSVDSDSLQRELVKIRDDMRQLNIRMRGGPGAGGGGGGGGHGDSGGGLNKSKDKD